MAGELAQREAEAGSVATLAPPSPGAGPGPTPGHFDAAAVDLARRFGPELPFLNELLARDVGAGAPSALAPLLDPTARGGLPRTPAQVDLGPRPTVERVASWQRRHGLDASGLLDDVTMLALVAGVADTPETFEPVSRLVAAHFGLPHHLADVIHAEKSSQEFEDLGLPLSTRHGRTGRWRDGLLHLEIDAHLVPPRDLRSLHFLAHVLSHELAHAQDWAAGAPHVHTPARHFEIYLASVFPGGRLPALGGTDLLLTAGGAARMYASIPEAERTPELRQRYGRLMEVYLRALSSWRQSEGRAQDMQYAAFLTDAEANWAQLPEALRSADLVALHDQLSQPPPAPAGPSAPDSPSAVPVPSAVPSLPAVSPPSVPSGGETATPQQHLDAAAADLVDRFGAMLPLLDGLISQDGDDAGPAFAAWADVTLRPGLPRTPASIDLGPHAIVERLARWQKRQGLPQSGFVDDRTARTLAAGMGEGDEAFDQVCRFVASHYRIRYRETDRFSAATDSILAEADISSGPVRHGGTVQAEGIFMVMVDTRVVPPTDDRAFDLLAHTLAHELAHADDFEAGRGEVTDARHLEIYLASVFPAGRLPALRGFDLVDTAANATVLYARIPDAERTPELRLTFRSLVEVLYAAILTWVSDGSVSGGMKAQAAAVVDKSWAELPEDLRTPYLIDLHHEVQVTLTAP